MRPQRRWIESVLRDSLQSDITLPWARRYREDRAAA